MESSGKEIDLEQISEKLEIPLPVLEWNTRQNKDMKEGVHYRKSGGIKVNLLGFIILICGNLSSNYKGIAELLEMFFESKKDVAFLLTLQSLINAQLNMASASEPDKKRVARRIDQGETDISKERLANCVSDDLVPELTDAKAVEWSTWVRRELADYVRDQNNNGNKCAFASCLKQIYRIISDKHGVDFEEARADFCKTYGLPEGTKVSIFRIISDSQAGRNLFQQAMMEFVKQKPKRS